jgi:two-component system, cell cycle sensor histidine kinase and response regulator CckA
MIHPPRRPGYRFFFICLRACLALFALAETAKTTELKDIERPAMNASARRAGKTPEQAWLFRGDHRYPPFEYLNDRGEPEGFNIDIVQSVARVMNLDITIELGPWDEVRAELEAGRIDALTGMYLTPERDEIVDFSIPQLIVSYAVFVRRDSPVQSLSQVRNRVILVQKDDLGHDFVRENRLGSKVIAFEDWEEVLRGLSRGEGDCAIVSRLQGMRLIEDADIRNIHAVGPPIIQRDYCIAVAEGNAGLLNMINEGLSIIKTTGEYDRIYKKWFSVFDEHPPTVVEMLKYIAWIILPLLFLTIIAFIWSWSLNRKVRAKTRDLQTELKERARTEAALKESEARFRRLAENAPDVIFRMSIPDGAYEYINESATRIFGYPPNEILSSPMLIKETIHPDDRNPFEKAWESLLKGIVPPTYEYRIVHKSGDFRWLFQRNVLVRNSSGEPVALEGIITDITSRKLAESERTRLEAQLNRAEKMETLGTLAGGVAHDLNNVLGAIVGYPDLLLADIPQNFPHHKAILAIKESGERAAAIVQDLMTLARRGIALEEVLNINRILSQYLRSREFRKLKEDHPGVGFEVRKQPNLLNIAGSPIHISKIIMNLMLNAAEAIPETGKILIYTDNIYLDTVVSGYDTVAEGDYVVFRVSDDGVGIPEADLKHIFEPFYTRKKMGRSGSGLGMAVVWGAVKDHRGYIDIRSRESEGTTVWIYFPATREEIAETDPDFDLEAFAGCGETILVVDDVPSQRDVARSILQKLRYRTAEAPSGEEAVRFLQTRSVDLVLLDMVMDPGMDGLETYARMIAMHPGQKAIIASGFSETDRIKKAQKLGVNAYLKKPYTIDRLARTLKQVLRSPESA